VLSSNECRIILHNEREYIESLGSRLGKTYKIEWEDAKQEAYLACIASLPKFTGKASAKTYITRSIINHFLNLKRKRRVEDNEPVQLDLYDDADAIAEVTEFASVPSPEDILSEIETLEIFYAKLVELDEEVKYIIESRIYGDATFAEIAKELRQPLVNVRVKMHRALKALRRDLLGM